MKYLRLLNILPISFFICALLALPATAATYTIDGDLSDWGVKLSQAYDADKTSSLAHQNAYSDYWKPSSSTADYVIENNIDPSYINPNTHFYPQDWTKYMSTGTHIRKTGNDANYSTFTEPKLGDYYQPVGGEAFDIEALYFDDDSSNVYIAIVTNMKQTGYSILDYYEHNAADTYTEAGDIAIDLDDSSSSSQTYEYGIITHSSIGKTEDIGHLIANPKWSLPSTHGFSSSAPSDCDEQTGTSTDLGVIPFSYKTLDIKETVKYEGKNDRDVYKNVIEVSIPKSLIGNPKADTLSKIHLTIGCGNDVIELDPVRFKHNIPEFPSIVLPVAAIMGIILILGRRKNE